MSDATSDCELRDDWLLEQDVNALSSLAYVAAGLVLAWEVRQARLPRAMYGLAAISFAEGFRSLLYHGAASDFGQFLHDVPLIGALAFVAGWHVGVEGVATVSQADARRSPDPDGGGQGQRGADVARPVARGHVGHGAHLGNEVRSAADVSALHRDRRGRNALDRGVRGVRARPRPHGVPHHRRRRRRQRDRLHRVTHSSSWFGGS